MAALGRVHAYLTVCLTHRGLTDPVRLQAELVRWRTAWTHAHHIGHTQPPQPPPEADFTQETTPQPTGGAGPEAGSHTEAGENPARFPATPPGPVATRHGHAPAIPTGGHSDPAMRTAPAEATETRQQLHHAAATPAHHRRRWALSAAAAAGAVAAGVVMVAITGVLTSPPARVNQPTTHHWRLATSTDPCQPTDYRRSHSTSTNLRRPATTRAARDCIRAGTASKPPTAHPTIKDSYNHVNNGVDTGGGDINNSNVVVGGNVDNVGSTYNSYEANNSYNH